MKGRNPVRQSTGASEGRRAPKAIAEMRAAGGRAEARSPKANRARSIRKAHRTAEPVVLRLQRIRGSAALRRRWVGAHRACLSPRMLLRCRGVLMALRSIT
eukprot:385184-Pleurochrysis_carterae.AAC.1